MAHSTPVVDDNLIVSSLYSGADACLHPCLVLGEIGNTGSADFQILYANDKAADYLQLAATQLQGTCLSELECFAENPLFVDRLTRLLAQKNFSEEQSALKVQGKTRWFRQRLQYGGPDYIFFSFEEITRHKFLERQLIRKAYADPLTGLHNRTALTERLQIQTPRPQLLILFDIVHFRSINACFGQSGGDALLKDISERLKKHAEGDLFRVQGDRFALLKVYDAEAGFTETQLPMLMAILQRPTSSTHIRCAATCAVVMHKHFPSRMTVYAKPCWYGQRQLYTKRVNNLCGWSPLSVT